MSQVKTVVTSGIRVHEVRVRNFRSIERVDVVLDDLTLLIGENNSGKTTFLEALFAAIGAGRRSISEEDVYLANTERRAPKDRTITIDVLIRPADESGGIMESFPEGSFWLARWGKGVSQDDDDNDFVAIRTEAKWSHLQGEYVTERNFLDTWERDPKNWMLSSSKSSAGRVTSFHTEPLALYLLDAKRDLQEEMQTRGSFWHRLISQLGLSDKMAEQVESELTALNEKIIQASEVLSHLESHLDDLHKTITCDKGSVSVMPLARHLRDLRKGLDVSFATRGAQSFPLARHGMGTRSLAAVLTFRAYTTWRQVQAAYDSVHPMLALEEPEAHLHPHAQRALLKLVHDIPGQRIVSTHSPFVACRARVSSLRLFRKVGSQTHVTSINAEPLSVDDLRKIDRMVLNTRGDILFSQAIVFCSGETEEQLLQLFGEKYWGRHPYELGITVVGVGGDASYTPFLRLAQGFEIPWYIFSDGEQSAIARIEASLAAVGLQYPDGARTFVLPGGKNIEAYLASKRYLNALISVAISMISKSPQHTAALEREWAAKKRPRSELIKFLTANKTRYPTPVVAALTGLPEKNVHYPRLVRSLLSRISGDLGLSKAGN